MARAKRGRQAKGLGALFQRKDNLWVATVELGQDGGTGNRVRRNFAAKSQAEAIAKRAVFLQELADGVQIAQPGRGYSVGEWLQYWLDNIIKPEREPTTYENYETMIRLYIKPLIGAIPLKALEAEHIEAWKRQLRKRGVGVRTQQVAMARLRTALNVALGRRHQTGVRFNAAALVEMPRSRSQPVQKPNLADARALLDAARGHRLEAYITVGLSMGLRRGEVAGLRWEEVDFEARTLTIRRRVIRVGKRATGEAKGVLLIREGTKMHPDSMPQTVALPDLMIQALKGHRQRQLVERLRAGDRWKGPEPTRDGKPVGFVFTSAVGTVLEPRNVFRVFESVRAKAGLDEKTFHQLRHDCASLLLAQGVPMYAVSQILRHSSPAITARFYAHLTPELQREAAAVMDGILGPLLADRHG